MTAGYSDSTVDSQSYLMPGDLNHGMYDGTSSESSASSPLNYNGYDNTYAGNGYMAYPAYPMQYPPGPVGLIPVELDIEGLYEDHDRRRRKNGTEKVVASHVHSRRRAQNRASQRAFRDRKEKHMRELEARLAELEGRHSNTLRSYEALQQEYSSVKSELDRLRKNREGSSSSSRDGEREYVAGGWDENKGEILDPLLFDVSAFCFDQDDGPDGKA